MSLRDAERVALVQVAHSLSASAGEDDWIVRMIQSAGTASTRAELVTAAIEALAEAEQIAALDALSQGIKDAAAIRWA